jgi:hypothetical protein
MKNLKSLFLITTALTALGLAVGAGWFGIDPTYSQVGIFISAGLFALYYQQAELRVFDIILLPLAIATVFYQGLASLCFDVSIFYYIVYRFGPDTEKNSVFGISLLIPLLFISKMNHILPEMFVTSASWITLVFMSLHWPIKKFEYENSKPWMEWLYCLIAIGLFFDNQLYNYFHVEYGLLVLGVMAMLSHLPKLSMLFALLSLQTISGFDPEVNVLLYSTIWFEVYGAFAFLLMSPLFTRQPQTSPDDIAVFYSCLSLFYLSVTSLFIKQKYREYWQAAVLIFVLTVVAFESKEHWAQMQDQFGEATWLALLPALAATLASFLIFKGYIKPLTTKRSASALTYEYWLKNSDIKIQPQELMEFTPEKNWVSRLSAPTVLLIIVGLALFTMGFLWLASIA